MSLILDYSYNLLAVNGRFIHLTREDIAISYINKQHRLRYSTVFALYSNQHLIGMANSSIVHKSAGDHVEAEVRCYCLIDSPHMSGS